MDAELVENSGAALGQSALDLVKHSLYPSSERGLAGQQREAFINEKSISE
jgi:hypothetical protein